jgi:hypothetical protein
MQFKTSVATEVGDRILLSASRFGSFTTWREEWKKRRVTLGIMDAERKPFQSRHDTQSSGNQSWY